MSRRLYWREYGLDFDGFEGVGGCYCIVGCDVVGDEGFEEGSEVSDDVFWLEKLLVLGVFIFLL